LLCRVSAIVLFAEEAAVHDWFRPWGWFHRPSSAAGAVIWLLAAIFCLTVFLAVDRHSHSVSDTFYGVFPYFVPTLLVLDRIAARTGGEPARPLSE
jgi:hypothetical protein